MVIDMEAENEGGLLGWMTNDEAMAELRLSKPTLQRYRSNGVIPYSKIGGKIYYRRSVLLDVLDKREKMCEYFKFSLEHDATNVV